MQLPLAPGAAADMTAPVEPDSWTQPLNAPVRELPMTAQTMRRVERSTPGVQAAAYFLSTDPLSLPASQPSDDSAQ